MLTLAMRSVNRPPTTKTNFDWIAPFYDTLVFIVFGRQLQQAQTVFLNQITADASVLIVGGGTGWLLEQVLTHGRPRRLVYLETSAQMMARASRRMLRRGLLGAVEFQIGNETSLNPDEQFDVILTPFVLDLFTEQTLQAHFIPRLRGVLKPDGRWIATDFIRPPGWWQKLLLWVMIRFFRLTANIEIQQLADWQRSLTESGLLRQQHQLRVGGMVSTEVWTMRS